jgi:hypothetical protein
MGRQLELDTQHANQYQHESAQQARHQVAKDGPYRRRLLHAGVTVIHQLA